MLQNSLIYISALPLFGVLLLIFIPSTNSTLLKVTALNFSSLPFILVLCWYGHFLKNQ
jgi:hypothetical protein